jgi:hypothetical protein
MHQNKFRVGLDDKREILIFTFILYDVVKTLI